MSRLQPVTWSGGAARLAGCAWFTSARLLALDRAPFHDTTGDEERALLVLAGTFDFEAGGKAWPQRGVRTTPFDGRPLALFVPRRTPLAIGGGTGEILMLATRDAPPPPPQDARAASSKKPLLALSGSGKAYDPLSGTWRREEDFADSPEFLLPRHIRTEERGGVRLERVMPRSYKSTVIGLDEAVLQDGATLAIGDELTGCELAIFWRAESELEIRDGLEGRAGDDVLRVTREGLTIAHDARGLVLHARGGRAYVAIGYAAGKSSTTT